MPYVQRDQSGKVVGRFANPQEGIPVELLNDNSPDLKPDPRDVLLAQLSAIDSSCGYNRGLREVILAFGTLTKMLNTGGVKDGSGTPVPDTTGNIGIVKVQALENQAKPLRSQLAALG